MSDDLKVMGSRQMTPEQAAYADELKRDFEALHGKLFVAGTHDGRGEAARLYAVARTQLELACMAAVKAVSRL
jgi:hypothetical protein